MTDTDRAWAAGFFDGEGHTRSQLIRERYRSIVIMIAQTSSNVEVLEKFKSIVGVGRISKEYPHPDRKPIRYFTASTLHDVQTVIDTVWPYLGTAKRIQAQTAIASYTGNPMPENVAELDLEAIEESRGIDSMLDNVLGTGKRGKSRKDISWFKP